MLDYYEVLGVSRDASTGEIRKAYKKLALSCHPDKAPEHERAEAEIKFKEVSEAYEVLSDEQERQQYDMFGHKMGRGGPNMEDMFGEDDFAEFFGGFGGGRQQQQYYQPKSNRTDDAHISIDITLEEIYKGKVFKMNSVRDVLCKSCSGKGGRPKAKEHKCTHCEGQGMRKAMRRVGPGLVTSAMVPCEHCSTKGFVYRDKDLCKRCKGKGLTEDKSVLEVYVPRGAKNGLKIRMEGKADEEYGKTTGDIIFTVHCEDHPVFTRKRNDLYVQCDITLAEALCGFSRILVKHLDGRGIKVTSPTGKVLRYQDYLKVKGEGMPIKNLDLRGDLYILPNIIFPPDNWCLEKSEMRVVQNMMGGAAQPETIIAKEVDEVTHTVLNGVIDASDDDDDDEDWEDENDNAPGGVPDCNAM